MNNDKKQVAKISIFITSIFVIFLSVTYAFINTTVTGTKRQVITSGNLAIQLEEGEAITLENAMPSHDEVGMIQDSFDFKLINKIEEATSYQLKLVDITNSSREKLDTDIVKYGLVKNGNNQIDLLSNIKDNVIDSGVIQGSQIIEYSLRLWIDSSVTDNNSIKDKTLSYRVDVVASQISVAKSFTFDKVATNLGESCKIYNDGTDAYLVGQCSNNYVSYSGQLWRVVSKNNETGNVKMITENTLEQMTYFSAPSTAFTSGSVLKYMKNTLYPTFSNPTENLDTEHFWIIYAENAMREPPSYDSYTHALGLLTRDEYTVTYEESDGLATSQTTYLNNGTNWWTLTMRDECESAYYITSSGSIEPLNGFQSSGVRPVINVKADVDFLTTEGQNGTADAPYQIYSPEVIPEPTLANIVFASKNLGENCKTYDDGKTVFLVGQCSRNYISYSDRLWRVVSQEKSTGNIKIVTQDSVEAMPYSTGSVSSFSNSTIRTWLNQDFYNTLDQPQKFFPATRTWADQQFDSSGSVISDDMVALLNAYEYYVTYNQSDGLATTSTNYLNNGTNWWLLNVMSSQAYFVFNNGTPNMLSATNPSFMARPAIQLNSVIQVATSDTADGTSEHPYSIEFPE